MPDIRLDPAEIARRFRSGPCPYCHNSGAYCTWCHCHACPEHSDDSERHIIADEDLVTVESKTGTGLDTWDF